MSWQFHVVCVILFNQVETAPHCYTIPSFDFYLSSETTAVAEKLHAVRVERKRYNNLQNWNFSTSENLNLESYRTWDAPLTLWQKDDGSGHDPSLSVSKQYVRNSL